MTTPSAGSISIGNLQTVFGVTSLGAMKSAHPVSIAQGSGMVSLGNLRSLSANITGWFDAASFSGTAWIDKSSLAKAAVVSRGNILPTANGIISCIQGSTTDGLRFHANTVANGKNLTLFHVTRYTGGSRGRIVGTPTTNWLSGHHSSKAGVAFHQGWLTPTVDVHGNAWVLSTDRPDNYRSNKVDRTIAAGGTYTNFVLSVNDTAFAEYSDYQCAEVVAFDRLLANAEAYKLEAYLSNRYYLDLPQPPVCIAHAKDVAAVSGQSTAAKWPATNSTRTMYTWAGFAAGTNKPLAYASGGYVNRPFIQFVRASSHRFVGSRTFSMSANGGFTAVVFIRFTGTAGAWERIFDFANGQASNNIILHRNNATATLGFTVYNGASELTTRPASATIEQDVWTVWTCRYSSAAATLELYKDNVLVGQAPSIPALGSRTLATCYIGQSHWPDAFLGADMSHLLIYDRALTASELTQAYSYCTGGSSVLPTTIALQFEAATQFPDFVSVGSPLAYHTGGFGDGAFLRLGGTQYASAGSQVMDASAGGGFTAIVLARFRGTAVDRDTIFDFTGTTRLAMYRNAASTSLWFVLGATVLATPTLVIKQEEWAVFACRMTNSTGTMDIYKNGTLVATRTGVTAMDNQTLTQSYLGYNSTLGAASNVDIQTVLVYDRALSDTLLTNAYLYCVYGSPAYTTEPWCLLRGSDLVIEANKGRVPFWGLGSVFQSGTTAPPELQWRNGTGGFGTYVTFDRTSTHHFTATTPLTLNIGTNKGFTAVAHVRFNGTAGSWERIFDFANGADSSNVMFARNAASTTLNFIIRNAATVIINVNAVGAIAQDQWAVLACRYDGTANTATLYKNNSQLSIQNSVPVVTDRTLTAGTCFVGRSNYADAYFNGDMRALAFYDFALTDYQLTQMYAYMMKDSFTPSALIKSFVSLKLWLDAEYAAKFTPTSTVWYDLSGNNYHFGINAAAITTASNISYMNFGGTAGIATRTVAGVVTDVPVAASYTIIAFTSLLNSTATFRTLLRAGGAANHPVLIQSGTNVVGQWWSGFYSAGYSISAVPDYTTKMNFMAFKFASGTWEMYTAPRGTVTLTASIANVNINSSQIGFSYIGGVGASQYWGNVASLMMFDRHLTTAELQSIYADQWARYSLVTPSVRATSGLILWLDAEYSAKIDATTTNWKDLSDSGYDFTVASTALTTSGGISYMNFSGTADIARRLVGGALTNVPLPVTGSTIIAFTSIKNSSADYRTLIRSTTGYVHPVLINIGSNTIGQWYNGFNSSGYDVTNTANVYTQMNFMAIQFFSDSVSTWTMYAAPDGRVQQVGAFSAAINTATNPVGGFCTIGGIAATAAQNWGNVASFMAFNTRLTSAQMQAIYDEHKGRFSLQ